MGDRVVATANHLEAEPNGFANGEVGTIEQVAADGSVVVAFASVLWLGETLSPAKVLGIALICIGVVLVSRSSA